MSVRSARVLPRTPFVSRAHVAALLAAMSGLAAQARGELPTRPHVVQGDIRVNTAGRQMTVNQTTRHGIVEWDSFSVGSGRSVHFNNGSGATLNRVTGLAPSRIDGTLSATGSLFLLNRNGVIIGTDGRVLTGGSFVASTRDLADSDFLDGGGFALAGDSTAGVTNLGKISSRGGDVLLAGYTVKNSGEIAAAQGRVGLAAGGRIDVLTDVSWLGGAYGVSLGERGNDVTNEGRILATVAELRAHNGNIYALAGNNRGLIQATGVRNEGGRVILTAPGGNVQSSGVVTAKRTEASGRAVGGEIEISAVSVENYGGTQDVSGARGGSIRLEAGSVTTDTAMLARGSSGAGGSISIAATSEILFTAAGRIDVSGRAGGGSVALTAGPGFNVASGRVDATSAAGLGGTVALLGERVSLLGATIDASGSTGGGSVYLGGGYQGAPVLSAANASATYVSDQSILRADATGARGDGGTVVVWADGTTQFAGKIFARGGTRAGDGGLVETSGLAALGVSGTVDASARSASGANGSWLLDPKNITIGTVTDSLGEFQSFVQGFGGSQTDFVNNTRFGGSLDLSGDTLIVGGGSINFGASSVKTAYIFESGRIVARLTNPGPSDFFSSFGEVVRIDGDIAAIADSRNQSSVNQLTNGDGTVYVYAKGAGWRNGTTNLTSTIHNPFDVFRPSGTLNTQFAYSIELTRSAGGQLYLVVPDNQYHVGNLEDAGVVWSAPISSTGVASPLQANFAVNPYAFNGFGGGSVAVSNGFAYIREGDPTAITVLNLASGAKQRHLNAFPGGAFIVSDGLLFSTTGGNVSVTEVYSGTSGFGPVRSIFFNTNVVAGVLAVDGDTMVTGHGPNGFEGSVSIFQAPTGGWLASSGTNQATLRFNQVGAVSSPSGNELRTMLGAAVAIDGDTVAVGLPGLDVATSSFGTIKDRGAVMIVRRSNGTWTADADLLSPSLPAGGTTFGQELAADGNTFIVSDDRFADASVPNETRRGRVYVYENGQFAAALSGIAGGNGIFFGFGDKIALSGDRIVATSAFSFDGNTTALLGRAELFAKGAGWKNGTANRVDHYDFHGMIADVAIDGTTLAVGTPVPTFGAPGSVFVFPNVGASFGSPITLQNPFRVSNVADNFGNTLALSGNTLAVGQPVSPSGGYFGPNRSFVSDTYAAAGLSSYNVFLFENLANNWSTATPTRLRGADILNPDQDSAGWGYSLALEGDTLVTGYRRDAPVGKSRGVYVFERNGTWAASTTPVARLTGSARNFGFDVDIEGDAIAVSSPNVLEGYVYGSPVGTDSPVYVFRRQTGWTSGTTNLVSTLLPSEAVINRSFGNNIALNDQSLFASSLASRFGGSSMLPVFQFDGPFGVDAGAKFATGPGANLNISAAALTASLSLGTDVTLQANNDITVSSAIIANNPTGDGGDLTLLAGRRILVNASITTDGGDLTLVADAPGANASFRDAGERVVVLGRDSLNNSVTLSLGTGDLVIAAADRFENRTGATDPFRFATVNPGRFLVYSATPDQTGAPDAANLQADLATAGRDWVHYGRAFLLATPAPANLPAGDGFIYTVQPTVGVTVGNASLIYGEAFTSASLTLGGITVGGSAVSGSVFGISASDLPALVNFTLGGGVSINGANGFVNAGTYSGGITATGKSTVTSGSVYGVAVNTTGAGTLTVAKKALNVRPDDATRVYRAADPVLTATYTGFVSGDGIGSLDTAPTVASTAVAASGIGGYLTSATGGFDNNYTFNVTGTGLLTITQRDLTITGLSGVDRVYDTTPAAAFTGTPTIAPLGGDVVNLTGALTATASFANPNVGNDKVLTFSGFGLSGAQSANYRLVLPSTVTADITPAILTLSGLVAADRDYDRTVAAVVTGTATIAPFGSDQVFLSGTPSAVFSSPDAGVGKALTVSGLSLSGSAASNYLLSGAGLTATIRPLALDVTGLSAVDRVYDATDSAPLSGTATVTPLVGDLLTVSGAANGTFGDRHAGVGKAVTVDLSGLSLSGSTAGNYVLRAPTGLTATVTPADLFVTGLTAVSRVYDATPDATLAGTSAIAPFGLDTVSLSGVPLAVFGDKHVGTAKAVTVSGFTLSGTDAGNYVLVQPAGLTASITPRPLTVSGLVVADRVYDASDSATSTGTAVVGGILAGDAAVLDASGFSFAFADKHVGANKPLTLSGLVLTGGDAANYDLTRAEGFTASITPAQLTISGVTALDRVYDATPTVALGGGTLDGVLGLDDIAFSTAGAVGTLADASAASAPRAVTASGFSISGTDAGNYTLLQPTGLTATISRATLQLVGLSADKIYDGNEAAPLTATGFDAVFSGDEVVADFSGVTATYADKAAGVARPVSLSGLFGLTGDDAANYTLVQPVSLAGTITPRSITVSGLTIADKVYDGTDTGTISGTGTFGGVLFGDDVAIDVGAISVSFANALAGVNKAVSLSGVTLSGADAGNYTAATPTGIAATIFQRDLTVTGLTALDRVYDRTLGATLTGFGALQGVLPTETITLDETARAAAFADKHVGTAKPVTVTGLALVGSTAGNYRLVAPALTASISPAFADVVGLTALNRVYDATDSAPLSGTAALDFGALQNVLTSAESISLAGIATGSFADKHVSASPKSVTVAGLSLAGTDASNYILRLPTSLAATVSRADLQITGAAVADKTYDASRAATISAFGSVTALGSDSIALVTSGAAAQFDTKDVGTAKAVAATGYALSGADAANYRLLDPVGLVASVARAELLLSGVFADDKVYDGSDSAPLGGTLAVTALGSDLVSVVGIPSASFADAGVGTAKSVTLTGLSLSGAAAANYILVLPALTADITPRTVTVGGITAVDRVYDGTRVATLAGTPTLSGALAGDDLSFDLAALTALFADKRVGVDKSVTLSGSGLVGDDAANYVQLLPFDLVADIAAKQLSVIGVDAVDRVYDRTFAVALEGGALLGAVLDDAVSLVTTSATGSVATRDVGTAKPVAVGGYGLSGEDAGNYTLVQPTGVDVAIAPRPVAINGVRVAEKFFDGTTTAVISGGTLGNIVSGDAVSLDTTAAVAAFADSVIGLDKPVTVSGYVLAGADAANYTIAGLVSLTGNILSNLTIITEVVPAEVLRASTAEAVSKQRAALAALAAAAPDSVVLTDYQDRVAAIAAGIPSVPAIPDKLRELVSQSSAAQKFLNGVGVLEKAVARASAAAEAYRDTAATFKSLGQQANTTARALQTEAGLRDTHVAQIERSRAELAKAQANLATIEEAKRRIASLGRQVAEAQRLGRGAEAASYEAAIEEARALVETEAAVRAERDAQAAVFEQARSALAASEKKIEELTAEQSRLAAEIKKTEPEFERLRLAAADAKKDSASALKDLEAYKTNSIYEARIDVAVYEQEVDRLRADLATRSVGPAVDRAIRGGTIEELLKTYPLSPGRQAVVENFETNLSNAEARAAAITQRRAEAEQLLKDTPDYIASISYLPAVQNALANLSAEQREAVDFRQFNLSDKQILSENHPAIGQLNSAADALTAKLRSVGRVGLGVTSTEPNTPANLANAEPSRGVANLDAPTVFAPEVETALKLELRANGVLMTFDGSPRIQALPVAAQLKVQSLLLDYVAFKEKQGDTPVPGFDPEEQMKKDLHNISGDLVGLALDDMLPVFGKAAGNALGTLTYELSKIGDARNAQEGFAQVGKSLVAAGEVGFNALTGGNAPKTKEQLEAEFAAKQRAEGRRKEMFELANQIIQVEDAREAASFARQTALQQAKAVAVARKLPEQLDKELVVANQGIEAAKKDLATMKTSVLREEIAERLAPDAAADQRATEQKIAVAQDRINTASTAIALISSVTTTAPAAK